MHNLENLYWFWVGKKDLINRMLNKYVNNKDFKIKILDVGCGTGSTLESLQGKGELYGVDTSNFALKLCDSRGEFKLKKVDAEHLKFPKNFFDVIIMSDIIEHVDNDKKAIENCYNILKNKGILIITVPAHKYLWNNDDIRLKHKRRYEKGRLMKISGKFKIKKLSYIHFFTYPLVLFARFVEPFLKKKKKSTIEMRMKDKLLKGSLLTVLLNWCLLKLNSFENRLLTIMNLPFGVGLIMILEKR